MKHLKHPIRNRTCDLPACTTVPQLAVLPHAPAYKVIIMYLLSAKLFNNITNIFISLQGAYDTHTS